MSIDDFKLQMKSVGVLYVDVYPYRLNAAGRPEFVLVRRNDSVELPGTWQVLSGKIREGERIRQAFWRQSEAKLGVKPVRLFKVDFVNTFYDDYYDAVMMVPTAACELASDAEVRISDLHTEFQWVGLEEVERYLIWPNALAVVRMIAEMLERNLVSPFHILAEG